MLWLAAFSRATRCSDRKGEQLLRGSNGVAITAPANVAVDTASPATIPAGIGQ